MGNWISGEQKNWQGDICWGSASGIAVLSSDSSVRAAQISQAHVLRQLANLAVAAQPKDIAGDWNLRSALDAVAWLNGDDSKELQHARFPETHSHVGNLCIFDVQNLN